MHASGSSQWYTRLARFKHLLLWQLPRTKQNRVQHQLLFNDKIRTVRRFHRLTKDSFLIFCQNLG